MAEQDYDRDSVDRAFAEMVAGYHLTAERPEPRLAELTATEEPPAERTAPPRPMIPPATGAMVPLVRRTDPVEPEPPAPSPDEAYVPEPLPPLARPGAPALVGWAGVLFAAVVVLAAGFGLDLPVWVGWAAVSCFIVGSVVLITQLPRHRPPDAGDGAVL